MKRATKIGLALAVVCAVLVVAAPNAADAAWTVGFGGNPYYANSYGNYYAQSYPGFYGNNPGYYGTNMYTSMYGVPGYGNFYGGSPIGLSIGGMGGYGGNFGHYATPFGGCHHHDRDDD
jgi:hypothetical protein